MSAAAEHRLRCEPAPGEQMMSASGMAMRHGLYVYHVRESELAHGTSLGNAKCWATSKATGAVERVFSVDTGMEVFASRRGLLHPV